MSKSLFEIPITTIQGSASDLKTYQNKVLLIVNTASECGFTPQYEGLNELYKKFESKGFAVLGFPCNQFGGQEPGSNSEIAEFCSTRFQIQFPLFSKIEVNGKNEHPLYSFLKKQAPGFLGTKAIKWNFTKFLVDRSGKVIKRFAPNDKPEKIESEIQKLL